MTDRSFLKALGPGLLFAGAAIGVSHLVQSTRAGATYGLGLIGFVLLANVLKYPAFSFGPRYAAATGTSLLEGYRRQGTWALLLYLLLTVGTMFTVQAAVTVVTAGLFITLWPIEILPISVGGLVIAPPVSIAAGAIVLCAGLLAVGGYRWLDRIMKVTVSVLTVSTIAATLMALPELDAASLRPWPEPEQLDFGTALFVAGLIGWMPSAIDVSVWHSLWTLARRQESGHVPTVREALLDFDVGYVGTAILAFCFLLMGAGLMHGSGIVFQDSAGAFASQVIALYTSTLGGWAGPIVSVAALSVMFSTTLTVVDGFARALSSLAARFGGPEIPGAPDGERRVYWGALATLGLGTLALLQFYLTGLKALVDLATTLSFLTAPVLAWLNHRAIFGAEVPIEHQPGPALRRFSGLSINFLALLALSWLVMRFAW